MATRSTAAERAEWLADMRETLPPGSTVYTVIRNVSRSGMSRAIDAYSLTPDADDGGRIVKRWLSYRAAAILGWPFSERYEAVNVSGTGMDMGFHLVYSLSSRLYPDGYRCPGKGCHSSEHYREPFRKPRKGSMQHRDGGYALRQEWL